MALTAHRINEGSVSLTNERIIILSVLFAPPIKRLSRVIFLYTETGITFCTLIFPAKRKYQGISLETETLESRITFRGDFKRAISEAIMPPSERPIKIKFSFSFIKSE